MRCATHSDFDSSESQDETAESRQPAHDEGGDDHAEAQPPSAQRTVRGSSAGVDDDGSAGEEILRQRERGRFTPLSLKELQLKNLRSDLVRF
jgi:hypothetical protein